MAATTTLQKITTRAKQIRKAHPKKAWTDCIKAASKEIKAGKKVAGYVGTKRDGNKTTVSYTKTTASKKKTAAPKKVTQAKLFGTSKKHTDTKSHNVNIKIGNVNSKKYNLDEFYKITMQIEDIEKYINNLKIEKNKAATLFDKNLIGRRIVDMQNLIKTLKNRKSYLKKLL